MFLTDKSHELISYVPIYVPIYKTYEILDISQYLPGKSHELN